LGLDPVATVVLDPLEDTKAVASAGGVTPAAVAALAMAVAKALLPGLAAALLNTVVTELAATELAGMVMLYATVTVVCKRLSDPRRRLEAVSVT